MERKNQNGLGRHIIAELYGCDPELLGNVEKLKELMLEATKKAGARVCGEFFCKLNPGVTGIVAVAESHLSIHTWPEYGYAAIDIFTCGKADPYKAYDYIRKQLKPKEWKETYLERGLINKE